MIAYRRPVDARERLTAAFPIAAALVSLELPEVRPEGGGLVLTLRLILWEEEGERRMVRDIKEQELRVGAAELADPRFGAFVEGWRLALAELFAAISGAGRLDGIEGVMPHDLAHLGVLRLKRPRSADDFCDMLLRPGRLGALLPTR